MTRKTLIQKILQLTNTNNEHEVANQLYLILNLALQSDSSLVSNIKQDLINEQLKRVYMWLSS